MIYPEDSWDYVRFQNREIVGRKNLGKDKKGSGWVLESACRVKDSQDRVNGMVPAEEAERTGKEIPQGSR